MKRHTPLIVGGICFLITTVSYGFGMYLLPMVLPEMAADLNVDYTRIGVVTGVGQVSIFIAIPVVGMLVRRAGPLRVIIGTQLFSALLLMGFYRLQGFYDFFVFTFLLRAWPVMVWIPLVAVAADHIPFKWRGTFFTVASGGSCFSVFLDGIFSSWFLAHSDWRHMWLVAGGISLACGLGAWGVLKWTGSLDGGHGTESARNEGAAGVELRNWFKSSGGIILNLIFLVSGLAFISFPVYLAPYLRAELTVDVDTTAMMWSVMGISGILGGLVFSLIIDRMGVTQALFIILAMGMAAAACIYGSAAFLPLMAMAALFGVAQAVIYGLGPAYISKVLSAPAAAQAFTIGTGIMNVGGLAGNFLGGWSNGYFKTFQWYYLFLSCLFGMGALLAIALRSEKKMGRNHGGKGL